MKLILNPSNQNHYPRGGLLIRGALPQIWLQEMQAMGLALDSVHAYAIPSQKANELYGCLLIIENQLENIGKNNYLQLIDEALFIPEYADISPQIAPEEWQTLFKGNRFVFLPEIGLFELNEMIDWSTIVVGASRISIKMTAPFKSVTIPQSIQTVRYELSEKDLLKEIENDLSDDALVEQLPFDLKKVLDGNQREIEKYLNYLEKYPEKALKLGIPLDTLQTSRESNWGRFHFNTNFLGNYFNSNAASKAKEFVYSKGVVIVSAVVFLSIVFYFILNNSSKSTNTPSEVAASTTNSESFDKPVLLIFITIMTIVVVNLILSSRFILSKVYNVKSTIVLIFLLFVAILFLLYPMYKNQELDSKLAIFFLILIGILLYRVFNSNATILKRDE